MKEILAKKFFDFYGYKPQVVSKASGRIEFIGNHVDYNGGVVLGAAISRHICVALAKRSDSTMRFGNSKSRDSVCVSLDTCQKQPPRQNWANYCIGVVKYAKEHGCKIDCGFDFLDMSDLPSGAGLSSSAAIELAMARALNELYGLNLSTLEMVKISKKCENEFMGMPCGILDQGVSGFGSDNNLVFIDCLKDEFKSILLPKEWKLWIFNTATKHSLVDGAYAKLRESCMQAAKILSSPGEFKLLRAFTIQDLENAKPKMDAVVYNRAKHIIDEIGRVFAACKCIDEKDPIALGKLLTASHWSSSRLFGNSCRELDWFVERLTENKNVYGARLSGGGFGGCVMAMTTPEFGEQDADKICAEYEKTFSITPTKIKF